MIVSDLVAAVEHGAHTVPQLAVVWRAPWPGPFDDAAARAAAGRAPEPTVAEWADMMPNWEAAG